MNTQINVESPIVPRRTFVKWAAAGFLSAAVFQTRSRAAVPMGSDFTIDLSLPPENVFSLSVASGDPTPTGVLLWTRIDPVAYQVGAGLALEVASDAAFTNLVVRARVPASEISSERDFVARVDIDGYLAPNQIYYYRFIYRHTASRTGRCRTLPAADAALNSLRLAFVTCQDFLAGYYSAFGHIAIDDSIDFVLHAGDYIYETFGDPRFQSNTVRQQEISLPSYEPPNEPAPEGEEIVVRTLADYRRVYQIYRSDKWLQWAHERHTWIIGWDDHEMADDQYHDYIGNANGQSQGAPGHPFQDDPDLRRQLKLDSQQAWVEYIPARVAYNPASSDIFARLQIYRRFRFGNLAELFLTDERTMRTPPPGGNQDFPQPQLLVTDPTTALSSRYFALPSAAQVDPQATMLGDGTNGAPNQREWLLDGLVASSAAWKIWSNEVYHGRLVVGIPQAQLPPGVTDPTVATAAQAILNQLNSLFQAFGGVLTVNNDAWDGYQAERAVVAQTLGDAGVKDLVLLTGDFHSTLASVVKRDYAGAESPTNSIGVEYMTPSVSSASFSELVQGFLASSPIPGGSDLQGVLGQAVGNTLAEVAATVLSDNGLASINPHLKYFESTQHGFSIIEFNANECIFSAFAVPRDDDSGPGAPSQLYAQFRTPRGSSSIEQLVPAGPIAGESVAVSSVPSSSAKISAAIRRRNRRKRRRRERRRNR